MGPSRAGGPPQVGLRGSPLENTCVSGDSQSPMPFLLAHPLPPIAHFSGAWKRVSCTCDQPTSTHPGPLASLELKKRQVQCSGSPEFPGRVQGTSFQRKERGLPLAPKVGNHQPALIRQCFLSSCWWWKLPLPFCSCCDARKLPRSDPLFPEPPPSFV